MTNDPDPGSDAKGDPTTNPDSASSASNAAGDARSERSSPATRRRTPRWIVIGAWGVGLLGVTTLVVPHFLSNYIVCNGTRTHADIRALEIAAKDYALRNGGKWPDDLDVLVRPDVNGDRFLDRTSLPVDPWGHAYRYERKPRIYSLGRDGVRGGEGKDADVDNYDAP